MRVGHWLSLGSMRLLLRVINELKSLTISLAVLPLIPGLTGFPRYLGVRSVLRENTDPYNLLLVQPQLLRGFGD